MSNHHILLVDDEVVVRMTTTLILKKIGCSVYSYSSGKEALAFFVENQDMIDLVIVDSRMPEMNGVELFHALREIRPDLKVVLASGFLDQEEMDESSLEGFSAILNKPYHLLELKELIETI